MHRRILEEKKREIEGNLKLKRREQEKIYQEIDNINDQPVYIPDFRKKEVPELKRTYTEPSHDGAIPQQSNMPSPSKGYVQSQMPYQPRTTAHPKGQVAPQSKTSTGQMIMKTDMRR